MMNMLSFNRFLDDILFLVIVFRPRWFTSFMSVVGSVFLLAPPACAVSFFLVKRKSKFVLEVKVLLYLRY